MSCLDATFTLKPKSSVWWVGLLPPFSYALLDCHGADFSCAAPFDFPSLYSTDRFWFHPAFASDPNLDYSQWPNRRSAHFLDAGINLAPLGNRKQLVLIFGFDTSVGGRVLVYSDAALLLDQTLNPADNQFALLIDSLDQPFHLYFIHAGGDWFFRGISGYLV